MIEQGNQPPSRPPNKDSKPAYQSVYERANKALEDNPVGSTKYEEALKAKEQIEKNHPELVDSANTMTEPSFDKTLHDNIESNKDISSKPSTQSDDGQSSTTATDDTQDKTTTGDGSLSSPDNTQDSQNPNPLTDTSQGDTSKGNLSGDYGQNADPNATGDFTYFLKNPDAPRSMNVDDMRDRYSQEKGTDNPTPTEPPDTGESDIT
jgi:hypothetical protein